MERKAGIIIGTAMMLGLSETMRFEKQSTEWQQRIQAEWEKSKEYPRKMKKAIRKRLKLEWAFASYDPFEDYMNSRK